MIKCNECTVACDFCKFYNFNGSQTGIYLNRGWCKLLHKRKDPGNSCKRFHCFKALSSIEQASYEHDMNFKSGEYVKVMRKVSQENGWSNIWVDGYMTCVIGKVCRVIQDRGKLGIAIDDKEYGGLCLSYPRSVLRKMIKKDDGTFEDINNMRRIVL